MNGITQTNASNSIQTSVYPVGTGGVSVTLPQSGVISGGNLAAMVPGETFQAEVVSREGQEATLRLNDGSTITARLGKDMALEPGKLLNFEVRTNGDQISISPLQTNLSTDPNALRALQMANLPLNQTAVQMTTYMMQNGMSVNRNALTQMFQDIAMHPGSDPVSVVDLHRLGLPVTDENLTQIESYKNLSYQLTDGLGDALGELSNLVSGLTDKGDLTQAATVMQGMLDAAIAGSAEEAEFPMTGNTQLPTGIPAENAAPLQQPQAGEGTVPNASNEVILETAETVPSHEQTQTAAPETAAQSAAERALLLLKGMQADPAQEESSAGTRAVAKVPAQAEGNVPAVNVAAAQSENRAPAPMTDPAVTLPANLETLTSQLRELVSEHPEYQTILSEHPEFAAALSEEARESTADTQSAAQSTATANANTILQLSSALLKEAAAKGDTAVIRHLLGDTALKDTALSALSKNWSISPETVSKKEEVEDLFRRLGNQLDTLKNSIAQAGLTHTQAFQSVSNMGQNLDFLQQVNQMFAYVQLPIRLSGRDTAHGDLYVYSNGRKLTGKEGTISALLHLDMEHLGPVDVYAALDQTGPSPKVNTQFYVKDDEILDLLAEHMDELTAALERRGYACACRMTVKGEETPEEVGAAAAGGVNLLLMQSGTGIKGSETGFDVRT